MEACGGIATVSIQERRAKRDPCMGDGIGGLASKVWGEVRGGGTEGISKASGDRWEESFIKIVL